MKLRRKGNKYMNKKEIADGVKIKNKNLLNLKWIKSLK